MRIFTNLSPFTDELHSGRIASGSELLRRVVAAGFDGVEINLDVLNHPGSRTLLDGLDAGHTTFHSNYLEFNPGASNPYVREAAVRQLDDELTLALDLDVRALTFHPGAKGKRASREESLDRSVASIRQVVAKHAAALAAGRTLLCMENMDDNPEKLCGTEDEIAHILDRVPELWLTCDVAHAGLRHLDMDRFVSRFGHRIRHAHASGVKEGTSHGNVSLEASTVCYAAFFRRYAFTDTIACVENGTLDLALATRRAILDCIAP